MYYTIYNNITTRIKLVRSLGSEFWWSYVTCFKNFWNNIVALGSFELSSLPSTEYKRLLCACVLSQWIKNITPHVAFLNKILQIMSFLSRSLSLLLTAGCLSFSTNLTTVMHKTEIGFKGLTVRCLNIIWKLRYNLVIR